MKITPLLLLCVSLFSIQFTWSQAIGDYRSAATGAWNVATTWQTWNGSAWVATVTTPSSTSGVITIISPHVVSITASVSVDQVTVNSGATLTSSAGTLTIASGLGLQVDGTFIDANATSIAFGAGVTWQLGATGTFIKNSASAIAIWHTSYQGGGGMAAIPATSNWIVRRTAAAIPSFSNVGITYGNLTFENTNATTLNISATGSTNFMTVKGNLDIGGSGTTGVVVTNPNSNATPTQVQGNMIVRASRTYTGTGTGISVQGTLQVLGTFNANTASATNITGVTTITGVYNANGTSNSTFQSTTAINGTYNSGATSTSTFVGTTSVNNTLACVGTCTIKGDLSVNGNWTYAGTTSQVNFTGGAAQTVSGAGTLQLRNVTINKTANDVTLNRPVTIDNLLTLTIGRIFTTSTNLLTIGTAATVTVTSPATNNSFVSGPVCKTNTAAGFSFPVGKGTNYQPLTVSPTVSSAGTFWTENFGTSTSCAAAQNTLAINYTGSNGFWTETMAAGGSNRFFVSSTEAGMGAGACGDGCLSNAALLNQTLHVGNIASSNCGCIACPTGDCGAAYDACGTNFCGTGIGAVGTDMRVESPTINCTGHTSLQLSFNYLENGQTTFDDAEVWYFDGATWALLINSPKTPVACAGAGIWTPYSVNLPVSADNNPSVKIGFRWIDNADDTGTDPSFAVDDITISEAAPLEVFTCEYFPGDPVATFGSAKDASIAAITTLEYWILDRNIGTASKQVSLSWDNPSVINTPAATQVIRWDGSQWRDHTNGGTAGVASNDPTCISQAICGTIVSGTIVSNFSPFTFGIPIAALPVELLDFTAKLDGDRAVLNWTTASERNTDHFTIEKSTDGILFTTLSQKPAAGNSTNELHYLSFDEFLSNGINYYRLKTVDIDGSFAYSNTASLNYKNSEAVVNIYPNPAKSVIHVEVESLLEGKTQVEIVNAFGIVLVNESMNSTHVQLAVSSLSNGVYFVRVVKDGAVVAIKKVVKE